MFRLFFLCTLLIISSATCKSPKTSTAKSNISSDVKPSVQRFIVSFYSIGSGAEGKQEEKLKTFVAEFEKQVGKTISFSTAPWGREGEVDFCFPLKELKDDQQKQFISSVKDSLQTAQWVHYYENVPCKK